MPLVPLLTTTDVRYLYNICFIILVSLDISSGNTYFLEVTYCQPIMAARCITRSCSRLSGTTTSSAAQAFVQLAPRKCIQNTPPVLDFLLPSVPVTAFRYGWVKRPTSRRQFLQTRTFASSARQQQTKAIFNPRKDDNGEVINIEILPGAVEVRHHRSYLCYIHTDLLWQETKGAYHAILEPQSGSANYRRKWWLPRLPIFHVLDYSPFTTESHLDTGSITSIEHFLERSGCNAVCLASWGRTTY